MFEKSNLAVPNTTIKDQLNFNNKPQKERYKDSRSIYFCISYSQVWEKLNIAGDMTVNQVLWPKMVALPDVNAQILQLQQDLGW